MWIQVCHLYLFCYRSQTSLYTDSSTWGNLTLCSSVFLSSPFFFQMHCFLGFLCIYWWGLLPLTGIRPQRSAGIITTWLNVYKSPSPSENGEGRRKECKAEIWGFSCSTKLGERTVSLKPLPNPSPFFWLPAWGVPLAEKSMSLMPVRRKSLLTLTFTKVSLGSAFIP